MLYQLKLLKHYPETREVINMKITYLKKIIEEENDIDHKEFLTKCRNGLIELI